MGGNKQQKLELVPIIEDEGNNFENFVTQVNALKNNPQRIDLYLEAHGLEQVEGLRDYLLKNKLDIHSMDEVNGLIQAQNYDNIASQAHGFSGVNQAIAAYNKSLTDSTQNTEELVKAIKAAKFHRIASRASVATLAPNSILFLGNSQTLFNRKIRRSSFNFVV